MELFDDFGSLAPVLRALVLSIGAVVWTLILARLVGLRAFSKATAFDFAATIATGSRVAAEGRTLRISFQPEDWTQVPWVAAELSRREAEGADDSWVPRPWTQSETCPAAERDPANSASSLSIAQVYDVDISRGRQRRGRPLEATIQLDADEPDFSKGLRLVLEGRVARWPTSRETVLCRAAQAYERPLCLVSAKFDLIAVENASNGERLADGRF